MENSSSLFKRDSTFKEFPLPEIQLQASAPIGSQRGNLCSEMSDFKSSTAKRMRTGSSAGRPRIRKTYTIGFISKIFFTSSDTKL